MIRLLVLIASVWLLLAPAMAHELRPGFLEIRQEAQEPDRYRIRFKVPARGDMRLGLRVRLPAECANISPPRTERAGTGIMDHLKVSCPGGLENREIAIDGLASTFTDVVVRAVGADGTVQTARLTPDQPSLKIQAASSWHDTALTYFLLGLEHIMLGLDHLLFVLALLLLIHNRWMLIKTITAFTIAHSLTLAAAALGLAEAPQTPVEAVVALSIAFAAAEVCRRSNRDPTGASRAPWIMAFAFGLLHGLGFGGALKEIGLPQTDVPLALLTFNLGVEAGQLLFVTAILAFVASLDRLLAIRMPRLRDVTAYGIGSLAAAWFIQRVMAIV